MPKDMFGRDIVPGSFIIQTSYGSPLFGVVKKISKSCIQTKVVSSYSFNGKFNTWDLQPYRKDVDVNCSVNSTENRWNNNIVIIEQDQYIKLVEAARADPMQVLLDYNPSIFDKKNVY
jgi:hypothetical protein